MNMAENGQQPSIEQLYAEIQELTAGEVASLFPSAMPDDQRGSWLADRRNDGVLARAEGAATARLLQKLGITEEEWLICYREELSAELMRLKGD